MIVQIKEILLFECMVFTLLFLFTDQRLSISQALSSENMTYSPLSEMILDWYFCCRGVTAVSAETLLSVIVTYSGTALKQLMCQSWEHNLGHPHWSCTCLTINFIGNSDITFPLLMCLHGLVFVSKTDRTAIVTTLASRAHRCTNTCGHTAHNALFINSFLVILILLFNK